MSQIEFPSPGVFARLGIKPVINACGIYTDLGGSRLSPGVLAGVVEMNAMFVRLPELLDRSGERIAELIGAPAARVTPGAAAGIVLGIAATMAGRDGASSQQLPNTDGMKTTVLIQAGHRYKYDRQVILSGARLIEVGSMNGTRADQLAAALSDQTAAIIHPAHLDGKAGTLGLEAVAELAHKHGVPVFVDAAYMVYPTELMASFLKRGADLVAISSKYFGGPNAGGFLAGRADLIAAVTNVDFTRYESGKYLKFGRPFKLDRQTVAAVVLALEEWLAADHAARLNADRLKVEALFQALHGIPGLTLERKFFTMDERFIDEPVNCLLVTVNRQMCGRTAASIAKDLEDGDPRILTVSDGDTIAFVTDVLDSNEVSLIGTVMREILRS